MTPEKKQKHYAIAQHALCCKYLDVAEPYDGDGDTLFEAVVALTKDRDEWKGAAVNRCLTRAQMQIERDDARREANHAKAYKRTLKSENKRLRLELGKTHALLAAIKETAAAPKAPPGPWEISLEDYKDLASLPQPTMTNQPTLRP